MYAIRSYYGSCIRDREGQRAFAVLELAGAPVEEERIFRERRADSFENRCLHRGDVHLELAFACRMIVAGDRDDKGNIRRQIALEGFHPPEDPVRRTRIEIPHDLLDRVDELHVGSEYGDGNMNILRDTEADICQISYNFV